jgi:cytochrome c-type biogenesis protein CcmH
MVYWLIAAFLALMTSLALIVAGRSKLTVAASDGALAIYKDQLSELDRDQAQGLINPVEAESQRTEISRCMLQASREAKAEAAPNAGAMPWYLAVTVPALAAILYWQLGSPQLPDVPRAARLASALANNDTPAQVALVEEQLEKTPDDATGWQVLMIEYQKQGRFNDAARALSNVMRIKGETGAAYADLAELLTLGNKGLVSAEAASAAHEALKREPQNPKAMFYGALALKQEGKSAEALALFKTLVSDAPTNAPWLTAVKNEITELEKLAPPPTSAAPELALEQMEEGMGLSPEERQKMIAGMVDGLEQRLSENGKDIEGWLRLIRARSVMGDRQKAVVSLQSARKIFEADSAAMSALDRLAKEAGLQ